MKKIDLNCDMGESFGAWTMGMDGEVIRYVTSANIACGYHAGDAHVMYKTVKLAKEHGVGVGAHPGYPDLVGFGRRNMDCTPEEVRDYVAYQIGAMKAFCALHGVPLQHVKPHGSLYNMSVGNEALIRAIVEAIAGVDKNVIYLALGGAQAPLVTKIAREAGIRVAFEAFPDRAYTPEGKLAPRSLPGAVIKDPQGGRRAGPSHGEGREDHHDRWKRSRDADRHDLRPRRQPLGGGAGARISAPPLKGRGSTLCRWAPSSSDR